MLKVALNCENILPFYLHKHKLDIPTIPQTDLLLVELCCQTNFSLNLILSLKRIFVYVKKTLLHVMFVYHYVNYVLC